MRGKALDLKGQSFGRLLVKRRARSTNCGTIWECKCDCGNWTYPLATDLYRGKTKSCGCYHRELREWREAYKRELKAGNFELTKEIYSNKPH